MKAIGLCVIVKNEAHIIRRCLGSALPLVDYFLVVDTGSEDGTQQVVRDFLAEHNARGAVIDEPWQNFGYNRTFALQELRKVADIDYAFTVDADDQLVIEDGFDPAAFKSEMRHDLYDIQISHGAHRFYRPQLCSNKLPFFYKAVVHEYLEGPEGGCSRATAQGFHIQTGSGGVRSRNPRKYEDDAAVLEKALLTEPDPFLISRYKFYLAQSYRDSGQTEKALKVYLERAELGFWSEEIFESLYSAGQLKETLGHPDVEIIGTYLKAYEHSPDRIESLHALVKYCHRNGKPALGHLIGKQAIAKPMPTGGLFVQTWIYDYGMLDEFAVAAYWAGHYRDCLDACLKLQADGKIPAEHHARVQMNVDFARQKLGGESPAAISEAATISPSPSIAVAAKSDTVVDRSEAGSPTQRPEVTVFVVRPPDYVHWAALQEFAETVLHGCSRLGYQVIMTSDAADISGQAIVIGAHLLSPEQFTAVPEDAIIYNSEHVAWMTKSGGAYSELLRRHRVWDYSEDNARRLADLLGKQVRLVPLGYVPELTRIEPASVQDIDVLFCGSLNPRRKRILHRLEEAGLRTKHLFGVYGAERDALIARAKVVLNMHYYEPGAFEIVRVAYLLANAKAVVSEVNAGEAVDADLLPGIAVAQYDDLADACRALVEDDDRRYALEKAGLASFQLRDEARILKAALDETFTAKLNTAAESKVELINSGPIRLNLGCGRGPQLDWTNIDSVAWPGVDIVADLDRCREIPLPFGESSVDEMLLSHVIEHLRDPLGLMQELHRLAKPGATLTIRVPYGSSDDAWEDPTHVRPYFLGSFGYFSQPFYWRADYGYRGDWRTERRRLTFDRTLKDLEFDAIMEMIKRERNLVQEMVVILTAVKPIREPLRELQEPSPISIDFADGHSIDSTTPPSRGRKPALHTRKSPALTPPFRR